MIRRRISGSTARPRRRARPGAIWIWLVFAIIPMLLAVACAVDIGRIVEARAELQNLADAAAVAGVLQLRDRDQLKGSPNQSAERSNVGTPLLVGAKKDVASQNPGPYSAPVVDFVTGYLSNPSATGTLDTRITTAISPSGPPLRTSPCAGLVVDNGYNAHNAVQVRVHFDNPQPLPLFFGAITGQPATNLGEMRAAASYENNIIGFRFFPNSTNRRLNNTGTVSMNLQVSNLLYLAINVNDYVRMFFTGPDSRSYNPNPRVRYPSRISNGSDGIREATLDYPTPFSPCISTDPSRIHFVMIQFGETALTGDTFGPLLTLGPSATDLGTNHQLSGAGMILTVRQVPIPTQQMNSYAVFNGVIQAGGSSTALFGQPRIIHLYDPLTSGPNHPSGDSNLYTIVGFGGIVVVRNDRQIQIHDPPRFAIQPEFVADSTAVSGPLVTAGGTTFRTSAFVHRPVALTRDRP